MQLLRAQLLFLAVVFIFHGQSVSGAASSPYHSKPGDAIWEQNSELLQEDVLSRLLEGPDVLPIDSSRWRSRRDSDSDVDTPPCETTPCPLHNSSSSSSLSGYSTDEFLSPPDNEPSSPQMKPHIRPTQLKKRVYGRRRDDQQEDSRRQSAPEGSRIAGRVKRDAGELISETNDELEKRDPGFNSWGGKRSPAFSSWGGKRAAPFSIVGSIRRRAFSSWGGKRSPAFNSWGGKRSNSFSIVSNRHPLFNSWGGGSEPSFNVLSRDEGPAFRVVSGKRRPSFNSWGGKRDASFSSWGGKRNPAFSILGSSSSEDPPFSIIGGVDQPAFSIVGGEKRLPAFSSWGGKRDPAFKILGNHEYPAFSVLGNNYEPAFSIIPSKRDSPFSSWGGKRDPAFSSWGGKRDPSFNSWGGKRDPAFSSWGGKRDDTVSPWQQVTKKGAQFSSWGGKRDSEEGKRSFSSWGGKRGDDSVDGSKRSFSSWGGKRSPSGEGEHNATSCCDGTQTSVHIDDRQDASTQTSLSSDAYQKLLEEFDSKIQLENGDGSHGDENGVQGVEEVEMDGENSKGTQTSEPEEEKSENHQEEEEEKAENGNQEEEDEAEKEEEENAHTEEEVPEGEVANSHEELPDISSDHEPATADKSVGTSELSSVIKRTASGNTAGRTRISKALFSPWGGKRSYNKLPPSLLTVLGSMHKGGASRSNSLLSDLLNKRGNSRLNVLGAKKWGQAPPGAVFSSWGGKRSDKFSRRNLHKAQSQNVGRQYRRGADFYSWGGK
ncbi:uncharacterized protein [Periplaneta americana]|uniref:uncharacterized protein n=1 Tax=Periplaneta americana TaxID=6978 RepID=UPI0037E8F1BA